MEKVIFKRAALSAAVVAALVAPGMALAAQDMMSPTYGKSYEAFMEEGKLTGGLFYFQRERDCKQSKEAYYDDDGNMCPLRTASITPTSVTPPLKLP